MKRKNLFLSLISSILVAVAIVTVTVVSVIKPNNNKNNGNGPDVDNINIGTNVGDVDYTEFELENRLNRDGSEEFPYIIYSVESFTKLLSKFGSRNDRVITKAVTEEVVGEDGQVSIEYKRDEDGRIVFEEVLDDQGNKTYGVYHFELATDVDFAGVDYVTLFNGESFVGSLDGKGYSLKNVSINVTEENFESFAYAGEYVNNSTKIQVKYSRIALFGNTDGAKISNINVDGLKVNVNENVYTLVEDAKTDISVIEMQVAGLIGYAKDTEISGLTMNASVNGSSFKVAKCEGVNKAVAGVIAYADNTSIDASDIEVKVSINAGEDHFVAGVTAIAMNSSVTNTKVSSTIETTYARNLTMAGLIGYAKGIEVSDVEVQFALKETASQEDRDAYISSLTAYGTADASEMSKVAGLIAELRANDDTQKALISNTKVTSNVDFDCTFAGLISDVYSTDMTNTTLVTINNISVDMNVNVLAFHGIARQLVATNLTLDENSLVDGYNIRIKGVAKLREYLSNGNKRDGATILTSVDRNDRVSGKNYVTWTNNMLFIEVSESAQNGIEKGFDREMKDYVDGKIVLDAESVPGAYTVVA